ncbi:MAG: hypothetical protein HRT43_11810 [Campylobacteraceae bacterium]|nr:hypothetical protein [Campylobacteraceae bacterium]
MKKLFWVLTLFIVLNITTAYFFLFTATGNGYVADIAESNLNEKGLAVFEINEFVLTPDSINLKVSIDSTSVIEIVGDLNIFAQRVDVKYNVDIKDLSKLQKITKEKLNGPVKLSGTVKGDQALTIIDGISDIFASATSYSIRLSDFEPETITFSIKEAKIDQLLYTVNQPIYAKGFINIQGDITGAKPENLAGKITTKIYKGSVNTLVVNENFATKLKEALNFKGEIITDLKPYELVSNAKVYTSMANLFVKKAIVNIKDNSINSDYQVNISDLSKLYDVSNTKMKGSIKLDGTILKNKDLTVTGSSDIFKGKLDFKLFNDDFTANVNNIQLKSLTDMLYYPEIFNSNANAKITYNLANSTGIVDANLINGHFLPNKFSSILNQFAKFDLTKEVYESVDLDSTINKDIIKSTVKMKSNLTEITVPSSTLDTKKRTIDAVIVAKIKAIEVDAVVSGSLDNPKIKVDTSKLLKGAAIENIKSKIMDKASSGSTKDILKSLKGFFN